MPWPARGPGSARRHAGRRSWRSPRPCWGSARRSSSTPGCTTRRSTTRPPRPASTCPSSCPGRQLPERADARRHRRGAACSRRSGDASVETIVDLGGGGRLSSPNERARRPARPAASRRRARVDRGELAYAWIDVGGRAVARRRRPASRRRAGVLLRARRDRPSSGAIDQLAARARCWGAVVLLVLAPRSTARLVARGILAPVEEAGRAAERIERGDLLGPGARHVARRVRDLGGAVQPDGGRPADTIRRLRGGPAPEPPLRGRRRRTSCGRRWPPSSPRRRSSASTSTSCRPRAAVPPSCSSRDVGRLRTLVEELMELSRFDADAEQVALEPVDLVRLIRAVIARAAAGRPVRATRAVGRRRDGSAAARPDHRQLPRQRPRARGRYRRRGRARPVARGARRRRLRPRPGRAARPARAHLRAVHEGRPVAPWRQQRARAGDRRRARGAARWLPAGDEPRGRRPAPRARAAAALLPDRYPPAMGSRHARPRRWGSIVHPRGSPTP